MPILQKITDIILFKRAIGYEYEEITMNNGIENKRVMKHITPDVTACIFWLKNRKPEKWRDTKVLNNLAQYPEGITVRFEEITGEEIKSDLYLTQSDA